MRKDEEVKEMFYMNLEHLKKIFRQKDVTVTLKGIWLTIKFGDLYTVKGRGYRNALRMLDDALEESVTEVMSD